MATNVELAEILKGYFPSEYRGIFLEVGAGRPVDISVSHVFRNWGWRTVSIEPNPEFVDEFDKRGLTCLPYACCAEDKGQTSFHVSPCPLSASALEVRYPGNYPLKNGVGGIWPADQFKTITVEALTLDTIMKRHHPGIHSIDILLVDTEGWELDVLRGFDLSKFSPKVILFEYYFNLGEQEEIFPYLESHNYHKDRVEVQDVFYSR